MGLDQLVSTARNTPRLDCPDRRCGGCVSFSVTLYSKNPGWGHCPRPPTITRALNERAVLREPVGHDDLEPRLDPWPTRFIPRNRFRQLTERGPTFLLTVKAKPKDRCSRRSASSFLYSRKNPSHEQWFLERSPW